jgi:hypothetical protein
LIAVTCAECGEPFEISEESAGATDFCPFCGALNDIPDPENRSDEPPATEEIFSAVTSDSPPRHGISAALWWTILLLALGIFLAACVLMFSDNWESRHVQALADATNRGDVLLADDDYAGALREYRQVIDTVGRRTIESAYIQNLLDRARRGMTDASARLRAPPQTQPAAVAQTQPAASEPAVSPPEIAMQAAMESFQRDYEAFPLFVRKHPVLFHDDKGQWRRRQYFVWQISYDLPPPTDPNHLQLRFDCASNITAAHATAAEARLDDHFGEDESPREVHCQTQFEFLSNRWLIARQDVTPETDALISVNIRHSLDDFYALERKAFHIPTSQR